MEVATVVTAEVAGVTAFAPLLQGSSAEQCPPRKRRYAAEAIGPTAP
ncbi:MAG: hypothetical protein MR006_07930 [Arcanobacterium sp.]|nr:hypothetical protein [Arcanobacterium sp.]